MSWDWLTTTGNYGTGSGGNGMHHYNSKVKRMSDVLAEIAEIFGALKPTNKEYIGNSPVKQVQKSEGKGFEKSLDKTKEMGAGEDGHSYNDKDKPALKKSTSGSVIDTVYEKVHTENGGYYWRQIVTENGDSIDGYSYTHKPPKKKNKNE